MPTSYAQTLVADGLGGPFLITGGLGGLAPVPVPVVPPVLWGGIDVVSAAIAWWLGTPAMVALTSDGRLWHRTAPEDTALPYATIALASERVDTRTTAYPFERSALAISAHAATAAAARALGLSIRRAFRGAPLSIGSSPVCHVLPDGSAVAIGRGLAPGGRDCWITSESFDICWTP